MAAGSGKKDRKFSQRRGTAGKSGTKMIKGGKDTDVEQDPELYHTAGTGDKEKLTFTE